MELLLTKKSRGGCCGEVELERRAGCVGVMPAHITVMLVLVMLAPETFVGCLDDQQ